MAEITCPKCGGTDFYLARQYKGTEIWGVEEATRDGEDGPLAVVTSSDRPDGDEYDEIETCKLWCNRCPSTQVLELEDEDINYG